MKSYEKIEEILKLLDSSVENLEVETPYGKCSMSCLTVKHKKNMVKKRKLYMFHTYRHRTTAMTNKFIYLFLNRGDSGCCDLGFAMALTTEIWKDQLKRLCAIYPCKYNQLEL